MQGGLAARLWWGTCAVAVASVLGLALSLAPPLSGPASGAQQAGAVHEGVATCAGSTCHGRQVASGLVVRQNELMTWQDSSGPAGAHSRAWRVLTEPRAQAIAARLGLGPAERAATCLACHAESAPAAVRGGKFHLSDGVGCEACHGGSGLWLASHYAVGAGHASNVARGMISLENPKTRAAVCLDCHFGSARPGQFATHRLMSAGHPRLSFELDLFTELQRHHDVDADYIQRKGAAGGVKTWAVGQAMALERALTVYADARAGQEGVFPEYAFFDCHSCHRAISDDPKARPRFQLNPGRPIPHGMAPFNDENMILLTAAARVAAPGQAARFEGDSHAFHLALANDRSAAVRAAGQLAASSHALADAFAARPLGRAEGLAMLDQISAEATSARFTDYQGAVQAVMAVDTLLSAMAASGQVDRGRAAAIRPEINLAYQAVSDPNSFDPARFRAALGRAAASIRGLK